MAEEAGEVGSMVTGTVPGLLGVVTEYYWVSTMTIVREVIRHVEITPDLTTTSTTGHARHSGGDYHYSISGYGGPLSAPCPHRFGFQPQTPKYWEIDERNII